MPQSRRPWNASGSGPWGRAKKGLRTSGCGWLPFACRPNRSSEPPQPPTSGRVRPVGLRSWLIFRPVREPRTLLASIGWRGGWNRVPPGPTSWCLRLSGLILLNSWHVLVGVTPSSMSGAWAVAPAGEGASPRCSPAIPGQARPYLLRWWPPSWAWIFYVIDLSSVVDKYIGETEKNLDRIFTEADRINGVLLFDEADALFGQRSEVRDARDRYANVEIAYLLQRMEQFDGLAILTTNLRANIDEAFLRRLDAVVDFPLPEDDGRLAIWRLHLPERLPQSDDIDLSFMASRFRLSGGHIRNICLTAAFLAADRDGCVTMSDIVRATEREYAKLGRLTVEAEFGSYLSLLRGTGSA